ncbi:hypothetical protein REPUB_Repub17cG0192500 [Reevesia pubescens]
MDEQPNERMISKLCEYASRNPLRIPRITSSLEQKYYKNLRSEQFHSVKVIVYVYRKLMISCKEQIDLNASDAIIHDKQDTENGSVQDNFSSTDAMTTLSWRSIVSENGEVHVSVEEAEDPKFWSRVCLHNMAKLAKEATTVRRVLESLFRFFDNEELWSTQHGVALSILQDMQLIIEKCGI